MSWSFLTKVATLVPAEEITVATQLNGKLDKIFVQEWEKIEGWMPLLKISDSDNIPTLEVENAKRLLDQALETKDQLRMNLEFQKQQAQKYFQEKQQHFSDLQALLEVKMQEWLDGANILKQLEQAEQELKNARLELDHIRLQWEDKKIDLDLMISNAKLKYESALQNYAQLTLRSPMAGEVDVILVWEGQVLAKGTPVLRIKGLREQPEIWINIDEYRNIDEKRPLQLLLENDQIMTGFLDSIQASQENKSLLNAKIVLSGTLETDKDFIQVRIPLLDSAKLFPFKHIKFIDPSRWEIPLLSWDNLIYKSFEIQGIVWDFVELKENLASDFSFVPMDFTKENYVLRKKREK